MKNNPFEAGDKVKCIYASDSSGKLILNEIYTVNNIQDEMVDLTIDPFYNWNYTRFELANENITFKQIFEGVNDDLAEKIGAEIANELMLKHDKEHADRWTLNGGTFTNKGLARRMARIFIETK